MRPIWIRGEEVNSSRRLHKQWQLRRTAACAVTASSTFTINTKWNVIFFNIVLLSFFNIKKTHDLTAGCFIFNNETLTSFAINCEYIRTLTYIQFYTMNLKHLPRLKRTAASALTWAVTSLMAPLEAMADFTGSNTQWHLRQQWHGQVFTTAHAFPHLKGKGLHKSDWRNSLSAFNCFYSTRGTAQVTNLENIKTKRQ